MTASGEQNILYTDVMIAMFNSSFMGQSKNKTVGN